MQCWEQGWCSCVVTCSSAGIGTGLDLTAGISSLLLSLVPVLLAFRGQLV